MINFYTKDVTSIIVSYLPHSSLFALSKTSKKVKCLILTIFIKNRECNEALKIIDSLSHNEWSSLKFSNLYPLTIILGAIGNKEINLDPMTKALIVAERNRLFGESSGIELHSCNRLVDLYYKSKIIPVSKKELLCLAHSCKEVTPILERDKLLCCIIKSLSNFSLKKAYEKTKYLESAKLSIKTFSFLVKKGASVNNHSITLKSLKKTYSLMNDFYKHDLGCLIIDTLSVLPNIKEFNKYKLKIINDLSKLDSSIFYIPLHCEFFKYFTKTKQDVTPTLNVINELCALIPFNSNHISNVEAALKAVSTLKDLYPERAKMYLIIIKNEINKISDPFTELKYSAQLYPLMVELDYVYSRKLLKSILNSIPENKDNIKYLDVLYPLLEPILQMT